MQYSRIYKLWPMVFVVGVTLGGGVAFSKPLTDRFWLTVNGEEVLGVREYDKGEGLLIGVAGSDLILEHWVNDYTLAVEGGELIEAVGGYYFRLWADGGGMGVVRLATNKPLKVGGVEVGAGTVVYELVFFALPGLDYITVLGMDYESAAGDEDRLGRLSLSAEAELGGEMMMALGGAPAGYEYFANPWESPDFDGDGYVTLPDFAVWAGNWLDTGGGLQGDFNRDDTVDLLDLVHFVGYWLWEVGCPSIIYVKQNSTGGDDGKSWDTAYDSLSDALLSVTEPDTQIWVAAGVYHPDTTGLGDPRNAIFTFDADVEVYGGFVGTEHYLDERDPFVNETILSGDLNGNDQPGFGNRADNSFQVVLSADNAILDGFTISGGYNADIAGGAGAGMFVDSDMEVRNCRVKDNWSNLYGGGIYIEDAVVTLQNCLLVDNAAYNGVTSYGGGIFAYYSAGNENKQFEIINCTISSNQSINENLVYNGSGVYVYSNTNTHIKNSIVWGNVLEYSGQGYYDDICAGSSTVTASYCNYGDSYNVVDGGNNLSIDPLFADTANGDYHLKSATGRWDIGTNNWVTDSVTSLCIDAGDPADDYSNEPTPNGSRINMGYYGNTAYASKDGYGSLTINITPSAAVSAGAQWTLLYDNLTYYDGQWHDSSESINVPININFYICLKDIEGYLPANTDLNVAYNSFSGDVMYPYGYDTTYSFTINQNDVNVSYEVATIIHVSDQNGSDSGTGNEYAPYKTIQHAISSGLGSQIVVYSGIYNENINIDRNISVYSYYGSDYTAIQGNGSGHVVMISNGTLSGFTITGGSATHGGGVWAEAGEIRNCTITNNYATLNGGGIYYAGGGIFDLFNCKVYGNANGVNGDGDQVYSNGFGDYFIISYCQITGLYYNPSDPDTFFTTNHCCYNTAQPKPVDVLGTNSNY